MTRPASASRLLLPLAVFAAGSLLSLGLFTVGLVYAAKCRLTTFFEYHSPSGAASVAFCRIGEAEWPFGPATIRVCVTTDQVVRREVAVRIFDGSGAVTRENVRVQWLDQAVRIILNGEGQTDCIFEISLE